MSHTLPTWIGRMLGIDAASGEGVVWSIDCVWAWPPWLTLLFMICAAALIAAIYLRESGRSSRACRLALAGMRLALVAILLLMISQVMLSLKRTGLPYMAVLLDDSLSMTIADHYDEATGKIIAEQLKDSGDANDLSRFHLAQTLLTRHNGELLRNLAEEYRLRAYATTGSRPIGTSGTPDSANVVEEIRSMKPAGASTRLGDGVRSILDELRGAAPAAILLLTDGINTEGISIPDAAQRAKRHGVPLFFIGLGNERPNVDAKLSDLLVDNVVFVDDVVHFECMLTAHGMAGRKLDAVLRERDKPAVLAKVAVTVGADGEPQPIRLPYRPTQTGLFDYVVSIEPGEQAPNLQTNQLSQIVEVRKEKIRVLLANGYPSFEFRYLRNMLQRDETISLSTVLQEADLQHAEQDSSALRVFPTRREEIFAYDVIIFGDLAPSMLSESTLQHLADFADQPGKGGALVFIAGPRYMPTAYRATPLARLLPFDAATVRAPDAGRTIQEGFQVQPTDLGLASPTMQLGDDLQQTRTTWAGLPSLYWLLEIPSVKPGVRVLATASGKSGIDGRPFPVITLQYAGAGKVLFHATDETWRWRWRTGDQFFARYWIQTIRYLSRAKLADAGKPVTLSADRREYAYDEPVRLRANFADERLAPAEDDGVTVVVEQAGRPTQRIALHREAIGRGSFEAALNRVAPGNYHAWIAAPALEGHSPAVDFAVAPPAGEFAHVQMNGEEMRQAASLTGGEFYTLNTVDRLLNDLPAGHQVPVETLPPYPLWNRWPVLATFLALLIAEWLLRKRHHML